MLSSSFIVFSLFFVYFVKSSCPNGSLEYNSKCYIFNTTESGFSKAEFSCIEIGGHLASIHDGFVNGLLGQEAPNISHNDIWIGANKLNFNQNWTWTDATPFDFKDWNQGEPQNTSGFNCAALSMIDGYWSAQECYNLKPFVCLISEASFTTPSPSFCADGWNYLESTHSCYSSNSDKLQNWTNAENECNNFGAHLSSIHTYEELSFVAKIASIRGNDDPWLGGYTDDDGISWKWTDKTPMDFPHWKDGKPDYVPRENCVLLTYDLSENDNNLSNIYFDNLSCYQAWHYICKKKL